MSISSLTTDELIRLESTLRVLVTPASYPSAEAWRVDVHRHLRQLVDAEVLNVLMPIGSDAEPWYCPDGDEQVMDDCLADFGRKDPVTPRLLEPGVEVGHFQFTTIVRVTLDETEVARLWFTYERRDWSEDVIARRTALLRTVVPALRAGLAAVRAAGSRSASVARLLDGIGSPLVLCTVDGRFVHANPALTGLLASLPEAGRLRFELESAARSVGRMQRRGTAPAEPMRSSRELRIGERAFLVHTTLQDEEAPGRGPGVLLAVESAGARPLTDEALRDRFGLTEREVEVARLLADGHSNVEISAALGIRPATARNHVERVRNKMGVRSRARVAATLCGPAA